MVIMYHVEWIIDAMVCCVTGLQMETVCIFVLQTVVANTLSKQ